VFCPVRRPVTTLDCVLLKDNNQALIARSGPEINSRACLCVLQGPRHNTRCYFSIQRFICLIIFCLEINGEIIWGYKKKSVKVTLVQALWLCTGCTAHRGSRGIALLFHDHGTRRGWGVSITPQPLCSPGKSQYPLYRRLGGPQGRFGQVRKNLAPTRIRSPDSRLSYRGPLIWGYIGTLFLLMRSFKRCNEVWDMNKVAAVLCVGIVMHEAHSHMSTWLSETYVSTTACLNTVSLLKVASVLQQGVKFCSELGEKWLWKHMQCCK